eukprot:scaffold7310_cov154-Skeletonema_dohrnii-CCMP3373.AAC.11
MRQSGGSLAVQGARRCKSCKKARRILSGLTTKTGISLQKRSDNDHRPHHRPIGSMRYSGLSMRYAGCL